MGENTPSVKVVAENRRAFHDYHVLEKLEAGLALTGTEIKSARQGKVQLRDAYADVIGGEAWLLNAHFSPYSHGNIWNHEPTRKRKLLLHRQEIDRLASKVIEKGLTLIPLRLYLKKGRLKCELGVCRGKKLHDRREAEQAREKEMEARRAMSLKNARRIRS
ncbi:MAG: SsrA-binding protein SmpB [Bryobacteraceae bacterium]|nr:SsrA-binding protein SmpB [Bryobacteraceae bacterium]MCX7602460.1 SsrA-binding protein SmpB [Bryobacteraceae bacterium]